MLVPLSNNNFETFLAAASRATAYVVYHPKIVIARTFSNYFAAFFLRPTLKMIRSRIAQ